MVHISGADRLSGCGKYKPESSVLRCECKRSGRRGIRCWFGRWENSRESESFSNF